MALKYGEGIAQQVVTRRLVLTTNAWTPLQYGDDPLAGRRHLRIQVLAASGGCVALQYANGVTTCDSKGVSSRTFTAPTDSPSQYPRVAGGQTVVEPVGENVEVYGRLILKDGVTDNSAQVMVTEYA